MAGFKTATREAARARIAIDGPSGSGKTLTALRFAHELGGRIGVIDSEHGRTGLYVGLDFDGRKFAFAKCDLDDFSPAEYVKWISFAAGRFDTLVIDSLSHAWMGAGGALEMVDQSDSKSSFTAWKDVTPLHRRMIEAIIGFPGDVICTMRSKTEYVLEKNAKGKDEPRKVGMAPVQRKDMEYEFDLYCSMDMDHELRVVKSNGAPLDGLRCHKPDAKFIQPYVSWLRTGVMASPAGPRVEMATDPQVKELLQLCIDTGAAQKHFRTELARRYTVEQAHQLTTVQAEEILVVYRQRLADQRGSSPAKDAAPVQDAAAPVARTAAGGEASTLQDALAAEAVTSPVVPEEILANGPCTRAQIIRLVDVRQSMFALRGWGDEKADEVHREKAWKIILDKRSVKSAKELTWAQCGQLIASLQAAVDKMTAEAQDKAAASRKQTAGPESPAAGAAKS